MLASIMQTQGIPHVAEARERFDELSIQSRRQILVGKGSVNAFLNILHKLPSQDDKSGTGNHTTIVCLWV